MYKLHWQTKGRPCSGLSSLEEGALIVTLVHFGQVDIAKTSQTVQVAHM
jgi:hypothetical protein